jgi:hypothetical protein
MEPFIKPEKLMDAETTSRIFLTRVSEKGQVYVINQLAKKMKLAGCPVAVSEEMDSVIAISKMVNEPDITALGLKSILKSNLGKGNSCSKMFDKVWNDTFADYAVIDTWGENEASKLKHEDPWVEAFLNDASATLFRKIAEKGTFKFTKEMFYTKGEGTVNTESDIDEAAKKIAISAFNACKDRLKTDETASDKAFNCLDQGLNFIKQHEIEVVERGNMGEVYEIPGRAAGSVKYLRKLIDEHFLGELK